MLVMPPDDELDEASAVPDATASTAASTPSMATPARRAPARRPRFNSNIVVLPCHWDAPVGSPPGDGSRLSGDRIGLLTLRYQAVTAGVTRRGTKGGTRAQVTELQLMLP